MNFRRHEDIDPELIWRLRLHAEDVLRSRALNDIVSRELAGQKPRQKPTYRVDPKKIRTEASMLIREEGGRMRCAALWDELRRRGYTRDQIEVALTAGRFPSKKDRDGVWWRLLPVDERKSA